MQWHVHAHCGPSLPGHHRGGCAPTLLCAPILFLQIAACRHGKPVLCALLPLSAPQAQTAATHSVEPDACPAVPTFLPCVQLVEREWTNQFPNFDNVGNSLLVCFITATLNGYTSIMQNVGVCN